MKNAVAVFCSALVLCLPVSIQAEQPQPARTMPSAGHRVVFELTSGDPAVWTAVVNNIENIRKSLGAGSTSVKLVVHGNAIALLQKATGAEVSRMQSLAADGVVFAACENTMKRKSVTRDQLLPFVETVDSGVAELIRKQEAGWSYIRSG